MAVTKTEREQIYRLTLITSPPPHVHAAISVDKMVHWTACSLLPAAIWLIYLFGWEALRVMVLCTGSAVLAEMAALKLRKRPLTIDDGTAVLTGLILALTLPPTTPSWVAIFGGIFSIVIGKQVFGGTGCNPFNPAVVGRVFLAVAFPGQISTWALPFSAGTGIPSPMELWKTGEALPGYQELLSGSAGSFMAEFAGLMLLLGGIVLVAKGYVDWRIPVGMLATVSIFMVCVGEDPLWHLLVGGVVLGAFYLAGDPVTNPITPWGRLVFGVGVGLILAVIRYYGQNPDALFYAILLMNGLSPLLNRFLRAKRRGAVS